MYLSIQNWECFCTVDSSIQLPNFKLPTPVRLRTLQVWQFNQGVTIFHKNQLQQTTNSEVTDCNVIDFSLISFYQSYNSHINLKFFRCKRTVIATKQFKIAETPNVLVLHLKRFQFGGFTGKLKNQITFPEHLDLANWTKQKVIQILYICIHHHWLHPLHDFRL